MSAYNDAITAYSTLALAVVTIALAIYTFKLWKITREMVISSEKTAIGQLRAYLYIDSYKYLSHHDAETNSIWWSIHPIWKNGGVTPAMEVSINTSSIILNEKMDDNFKLHDDFVCSHETIIGQNTIMEGRAIPITSADIIAIRNGEKFFYIWGSAKYKDVFPNTPVRITRFCSTIHSTLGDPTKAYHAESNIVEINIGSHTRNNFMEDAPPK
jgi:hypothetical protein